MSQSIVTEESLEIPTNVQTSKPARPFIKWPGGKTQLLPELLPRVPKKFNYYYEPFLGGGALFFALRPQKAIISDLNWELMNAFKVIRDNPLELIEKLRKCKNTESFYYKIRNADREESFHKLSPMDRAVRFIYLNKTCFNGLYRVNKKDQFNVPFAGYKNPKICDTDNIMACHKLFTETTLGIEYADYRFIVGQGETATPFDEEATEGDFVYLDPPYIPLSITSSFTAYTKDGFGMKDQVILRDVCDELTKRGVLWMQSNSSAPATYELYSKYNIEEVSANRNISAYKKRSVKEVIIRNYK